MDVSRGGRDRPTTDTARIVAVRRPARRLPETTPSGTPSAVASSNAATASSAVFSARSPTSSVTGLAYLNNVPRSNLTRRPSHTRYCSASGRSSPNRSRSRATVSVLTPGRFSSDV